VAIHNNILPAQRQRRVPLLFVRGVSVSDVVAVSETAIASRRFQFMLDQIRFDDTIVAWKLGWLAHAALDGLAVALDEFLKLFGRR
jgi:hypothetical protein